MLQRHISGLCLLLATAFPFPAAAAGPAAPLQLHLQSRKPDATIGGRFQLVVEPVAWDAAKTAIIVCDMWDRHWCQGAASRVSEMAPRMNQVLTTARRRGVLIVHAPSETMEFYRDYPQRKRTLQAAAVPGKPPAKAALPPLPIDDSDGGCDCAATCPHGHPWTRQIATLDIAPEDAIGEKHEIYALLHARGIENVLLMGVHTNMCVLGRPFGLRQMAAWGLHVALVRDLTDAMYNSRREPHVDHFRGTERVVEHIEKYLCPTLASSDLLPGPAFHFAADRRPHVAMIVFEDEYKADVSMPEFAARLGDRCGCRVTLLPGCADGLVGLAELPLADVVMLFARRKLLPQAQLDAFRAYLALGKPLVAVRTACHAFAANAKMKVPPGAGQWPTLDVDLLGCHYANHYANKIGTDVTPAPGVTHPILAGVAPGVWHSSGSLYKVLPLVRGTTVLLYGEEQGAREPVAWTYAYGKSPVFYTTLGHLDDFAQPQFVRMLINALGWAMGRDVQEK